MNELVGETLQVVDQWWGWRSGMSRDSWMSLKGLLQMMKILIISGSSGDCWKRTCRIIKRKNIGVPKNGMSWICLQKIGVQNWTILHRLESNFPDLKYQVRLMIYNIKFPTTKTNESLYRKGDRMPQRTHAGTLWLDIAIGLLKIQNQWTNIPNSLSIAILT